MANDVTNTPTPAPRPAPRARSGKPAPSGPACIPEPARTQPPVTVRVDGPVHFEPLPSEEEMQKIEMRNRAFLSTLSDPAFFLRKDGVVIEAYLPPHSDFTLSARALVGRSIRDLLPPQIGQQAMHYIEKACRTKEPQTFTSQYVFPNRAREFQARVTVCGPNELLAVVRDVSEQRLLEKEILEITNREQTRIGQDLHDGLGQHLTGITFLTRALENRLLAQSLPEAEEAAEIGRLVLQALSQTRNLARGLFPVELESSGLCAALRELGTTVEGMFPVSCKINCDEQIQLSDRTVQTHLFRLAQEAVNNSVKHGKAKNVQITLAKEGDKCVLSVSDDGVGFPQHSEVKLKGLGVRIMNYRAQKIGGELLVEPANPTGTVVKCTFTES
jgi:signal transduction histidine kinase